MLSQIFILVLLAIACANGQTLDQVRTIITPPVCLTACAEPRECAVGELPNNTGCCPSCKMPIDKIQDAIRTFISTHPRPCSNTEYAALPACVLPTSNINRENYLAALPTLLPDGCPSCRWPRVQQYLEKNGPSVCNRTHFEACLLSRPRCGPGQRPIPTDQSCCPFPCIPNEAFCSINETVACFRQQRVCVRGERPVFLTGSCCPSCRPPRPDCDPECEDNKVCIWSRQNVDVSVSRAKRQAETTVVRAVCLPVRAVRIILNNVHDRLRGNDDKVLPDAIRDHIIIAVRRFCFQGGNLLICDRIEEFLDSVRIARLDELPNRGAGVTLTMPDDPRTASVNLIGTLATGIDDIIQRAVREFTREFVDAAIDARPFDLGPITLGDNNGCRNPTTTQIEACRAATIPDCTADQRVTIDPITCCVNCRRKATVPRTPPPTCPAITNVLCQADAITSNYEVPRIQITDGCPHCNFQTERTTTTKCTIAQNTQSREATPDCPDFTTNSDALVTRRTVSRCAPSCIHPHTRCNFVDRIRCHRASPLCAADERPEFAAGSCCPSCRMRRVPVCDPACTGDNICVRDRNAADGGKCVPARRFRLRLRLATAIRTVLGADLTDVEELRELFDHLIKRYDQQDVASRIDSVREKLEAARDSLEKTTDANVVEIRIPSDNNNKRQGSGQTESLILEAACDSDSTDSSSTNCAPVDSNQAIQGSGASELIVSIAALVITLIVGIALY